MPTLIATDLRHSAAHPLRHSVMNVIRQVAEWRASSTSVGATTRSPPASATPLPNLESLLTPSPDSDLTTARNGSHYLLTSLTLFTTHEPCIMCSMALLHSRVKEVIFLQSMDQTGGCGGWSGKGTCVPRLKGVNHRFSISRWTLEEPSAREELLTVAGDIDA